MTRKAHEAVQQVQVRQRCSAAVLLWLRTPTCNHLHQARLKTETPLWEQVDELRAKLLRVNAELDSSAARAGMLERELNASMATLAQCRSALVLAEQRALRAERKSMLASSASLAGWEQQRVQRGEQETEPSLYAGVEHVLSCMAARMEGTSADQPRTRGGAECGVRDQLHRLQALVEDRLATVSNIPRAAEPYAASPLALRCAALCLCAP